MEDRSRTFNYIDKKGRLLPYIDNLIDDCKPKGKHPSNDKLEFLVTFRKQVVDGLFDWQPSE